MITILMVVLICYVRGNVKKSGVSCDLSCNVKESAISLDFSLEFDEDFEKVCYQNDNGIDYRFRNDCNIEVKVNLYLRTAGVQSSVISEKKCFFGINAFLV